MKQLLVFLVVGSIHIGLYYLFYRIIYKRPITSFEFDKAFIYLCLIVAIIYGVYLVIFQNAEQVQQLTNHRLTQLSKSKTL